MLELYHGPTIPPARPCRLWPRDYDYDDDNDDDDDDCIKDENNDFDEDGEIMCTHWMVLCTHSPLAQSVTSLQLTVCHMTSHIMMMMMILTHRFCWLFSTLCLKLLFLSNLGSVIVYACQSQTDWLKTFWNLTDLTLADWDTQSSWLLCWEICNIGNICTICKMCKIWK